MEKVNVQMKLVSVNEGKFSMNLGNIGEKFDPKLLRIAFMNNVQGLDVEKNMISIVFGTKYTYDDKEILECFYRFNFSILDLKQYVKINDDKSGTISHIMPLLLDIALGTMRGIILVKTAGTILYNFPVPVINAAELNKNLMSHQAAN